MASKDREKRLQEMYELFASIDNPEDFKLFK